MIKAVIQNIIFNENWNVEVFTKYFDKNGRVVAEGSVPYTLWAGETEAQLMVRVREDVSKHCAALLTRNHFKNRNTNALPALKKELVGWNMSAEFAEVTAKDGKIRQLYPNGIEKPKDS